jgi:hypothetical protein
VRNIVVECKPDEALIRALGFSKRHIVHQSGKGEVINFLEKNSDSIGMVDEDPGTANAKFFSKFQRVENSKHNIDYYTLPKSATCIIVIRPFLEEWIWNQSKEDSVDPTKFFSTSKDGRSLHKIINQRLPKFEELLSEMLDKQSQGLLHLKRLINS